MPFADSSPGSPRVGERRGKMSNPISPAEASSPVEITDTLSAESGPQPGIALCLSGGGYRAMVFHAGVLWRLNELGLLKALDRVSSVSGGSITAGLLGLKWT